MVLRYWPAVSVTAKFNLAFGRPVQIHVSQPYSYHISINFFFLETRCSLHVAGASHSNAQALPDSHRLPTRPWPQLSYYSWRHKTTSERHCRHVIMSFNRLAVAQNCLDPWAHKMLSIRHIGYPLFSGFGIWPGQTWTKSGQTKMRSLSHKTHSHTNCLLPAHSADSCPPSPQNNPKQTTVAAQPSSAVSPNSSTTLGSAPWLIRYWIISQWPCRDA